MSESAPTAEPAAPPVAEPPHGRLARLVAWVRHRSGLAAGLVGLYAVFRLVRGAAVFGWVFHDLLPVGRAVDWVGDHPWAVAGVCLLVFAVAAGGARALIGWMGRRSDARAERAEGAASDARKAAPAPGSLQPGDPLAPG